MNRLPIARHDFAEELFPIVLEAFHPETGKIVWTATLEKPRNHREKVALYVPPLSEIHGHPVSMRARFADGTVRESPPPEEAR